MSAGRRPMDTWDRVTLARHPERPRTLDFVSALCDEFVEFHGDRQYREDRALVGGLANFRGRTVMVIGHQKGRNTRENLDRNFGMVRPEGFRKALRLMRHAAKFQLPVLTFVDTPGADPGPKSEEHGQAFAIAECIAELTSLPAPIISLVIGEGGSGGALAIGVADRIVMLENAIYSVASPEASASILWKDAGQAPTAATAMRISSHDLRDLGIVDEVLPEPTAANDEAGEVMNAAGDAIERRLDELFELVARDDIRTLIDQRRSRYRDIGVWYEASKPESVA